LDPDVAWHFKKSTRTIHHRRTGDDWQFVIFRKTLQRHRYLIDGLSHPPDAAACVSLSISTMSNSRSRTASAASPVCPSEVATASRPNEEGAIYSPALPLSTAFSKSSAVVFPTPDTETKRLRPARSVTRR